MASFNRVVLAGNLCSDPELRYTSGKKAVVDTSMAVNERYKKDGEWVENTTFIGLTFWGRTAEVANEYLKKGSNLLIEGKLRLETWEDGDGNKRSKHKVVVDNLTMMGKSNPGSTESGNASQEATPVAAGDSGGSSGF